MFLSCEVAHKNGGQWAKGIFLILALPKTRIPRWYATQKAVQQRCEAEAMNEGQSPWAWRGYLTKQEQLEGYGEALYHPPFTLLRAAAVDDVVLRQSGHFMVGSTRLMGRQIHLSGSYGEDGLPKTLDRAVWEKMVPLPEDLCNALAKGDGHNSAGSEGPAIRSWAIQNLEKLQEVGA